MNKLLTFGTALALIFVGASPTIGQILLNETFSYPNGGLVAGSSGNWTNLSGTGTLLQVSDSQLTGLVHGSGSREDATRVFTNTAVTSGAVFSSFSFTVTTAPTAGQDYFFALHGSADTNYRGRLFLASPASASSGEYRLGISNATSTAAFTGNLTQGQTYYAVVKTSAVATGNSALWVGTSLSSLLESSPTATASDVFTSQALARVVLRQGTGISVANGLNFDNLTIGTTFADVTAVPEPSSFAVLAGLAALAGVSMSRRRNG